MSAAKRKGDSSASCLAKRFCTTRLMSGEQKGMLLWKIANFSLLRNRMNLKSPTFSVPCCKARWSLKLWTNYIFQTPDIINLTVNSSPSYHSPASAKVYVITASGKKCLFKQFKQFSRQALCWNFLLWTNLMKHKRRYFPNDVLTLCCELSMETKIGKTERCSDVSVQWSPKDSPDLQGRLSKDLDTFFDEKRFTDVCFKVGESSLIAAHKVILAARSPVFASMFEHQMQETITGQVVISDVDREVFIELLRFMYTERTSIPDFKFALKLLVAADKYNLESLKTVCSEYIQNDVTKDNIFDALLIADACRETTLMNCCFAIIHDILPGQLLESNWIHQWRSRPEILAVLEKLLKPKGNEGNVVSKA